MKTADEKLTCEAGLRPGLIDDEIFDRELVLCRQLSAENGGNCGWGECEKCGVIPLLYKLNQGVLIEEKKELEKIRQEVLKTE